MAGEEAPTPTESEQVVALVRSASDPHVLASVMFGDDPDEAALETATAVVRARSVTTVDELLGVPGVTHEALLRLHAAVARHDALGGLVGLFPPPVGPLVQAVLEAWVTANCTRTAGRTTWECVGGVLTLMDTDTYVCPDGSRHTIRRVRHRTDEPCPD